MKCLILRKKSWWSAYNWYSFSRFLHPRFSRLAGPSWGLYLLHKLHGIMPSFIVAESLSVSIVLSFILLVTFWKLQFMRVTIRIWSFFFKIDRHALTWGHIHSNSTVIAYCVYWGCPTVLDWACLSKKWT